jgi:hypothetical protein
MVPVLFGIVSNVTLSHRLANRLGLLLVLCLVANHTFAQQPTPNPAQLPLQNSQRPNGQPVILPTPSSAVSPPPLIPIEEVTSSPTSAPARPEADAATRSPLNARATMVDIDSRQLDYDEENNLYVATGAVKVTIEGQRAELQADKVVYDRGRNLMTAEGKVIITKNGKQTYSKFAKFDLNRETALLMNPVTQINGMKVQSQLSLNNNKYTELEKGQIIIPQDRKKADKVASTTPAPGDDLMGRIAQVTQEMDTQTLDNNAAEQAPSRFKIVSDEINVTRNQDGVDDIDLINPSVYMGKYKIARFKTNKVAFNEFNKQLTYLGPELGFDPALGGVYYGPGWDFRASGGGIARFSPLLTYGTAFSSKGGSFRQEGAGLGTGALLHYENENVKFNVGYSTRAEQAVALGQVRFLTDATKLVFSRNEEYVNGFWNSERPIWSLQAQDTRKIAEWKNFELDTHTSAGWYGDNFFPNNTRRFFVDAKGPEPVDAGRFQLQAQIVNQKPLLQLGNFAYVGFRGQLMANAYSTGDTYAVLRAGPNVSLNWGGRVNTNATWFTGAVQGSSPFVFDTYYGGKQSVLLSNSIRVNQFLTLGFMQNFSLLKDNSENAMLVGNQLFAMVGPPEVKLSLGVDLIRKRSFFGLNYFPGAPGNKNTTVDFKRLRIFEPTNVTNPTLP